MHLLKLLMMSTYSILRCDLPSDSSDYGSTHFCHLYFILPHFHGFKSFTQYIVYMHSSQVIDCISTSKLVALTSVLQLTCTHAQFPSCLHHRYLLSIYTQIIIFDARKDDFSSITSSLICYYFHSVCLTFV